MTTAQGTEVVSRLFLRFGDGSTVAPGVADTPFTMQEWIDIHRGIPAFLNLSQLLVRIDSSIALRRSTWPDLLRRGDFIAQAQSDMEVIGGERGNPSYEAMVRTTANMMEGIRFPDPARSVLVQRARYESPYEILLVSTAAFGIVFRTGIEC